MTQFLCCIARIPPEVRSGRTLPVSFMPLQVMGQSVAMTTEISLSAKNAVKGAPSIYHANFARVLEMPSNDFLNYLREAANRNPCVEVENSSTVYSLASGRLSALNRSERPPADSSWRRRGDNGLDAASVPDDFTDSLPVFLSAYLQDVLDKATLAILVDSLDSRGFLGDSTDAIARQIGKAPREVQRAVEVMKSVGPGGIGCRDLKDFLWFQCGQIDRDTPAMKQLIEEMLPDVAKGNTQRIRRKLGIGEHVASEMIQVLKGLRPYPTWSTGLGLPTGQTEAPVRAPDFIFERSSDDSYVLHVLEPTIKLDSLSLGTADRALLDENWGEQLARLRDEAESVLELSLRRQSVILAAMTRILDVQKEWLLGFKEYLEPLSVSDIALSAGVSVSAVSRALKDRYLASPRGTFALRQLLSRRFDGENPGGKSQDFVSCEISKLERAHERETLTDQRVAGLLRERGIEVARRTVNKYRKHLRGA